MTRITCYLHYIKNIPRRDLEFGYNFRVKKGISIPSIVKNKSRVISGYVQRNLERYQATLSSYNFGLGHTKFCY
jgi:hypothetical protein